MLNLTAEDLQPFKVGRDAGAPVTDIPPVLPMPVPLPAPVKPPGGDTAPSLAPQFPGTPGPVKPVNPPVPVKPPKGG